MPIARFAEWLDRSGHRDAYMQKLLDAFNPTALDGVMCRDLVSIGPDGAIYDCDFNQMLSLPVNGTSPRNIRDYDAIGSSASRQHRDRRSLPGVHRRRR